MYVEFYCVIVLSLANSCPDALSFTLDIAYSYSQYKRQCTVTHNFKRLNPKNFTGNLGMGAFVSTKQFSHLYESILRKQVLMHIYNIIIVYISVGHVY